MDNNEDTDELALYFAAKKENEELRAKVERLEKSILLLGNTILNKDSEIQKLRTASINIINKHNEMLSFIKLLDDYPMFWGSSYKKSIKQFFLDKFPEK